MLPELRLAWRYAREVYHHSELLVGSLVVAALLAIIDWLVEEDVPTWFYVLLVAVILVVAQYRAWRKLALQADGVVESDGLKLLFQAPGFMRDQDQPHHVLVFEFESETELQGRRITLSFDAPIYYQDGVFRALDRGHIVWGVPKPKPSSSVSSFILDCSAGDFKEPCYIAWCQVYSVQPFRLTRLESA